MSELCPPPQILTLKSYLQYLNVFGDSAFQGRIRWALIQHDCGPYRKRLGHRHSYKGKTPPGHSGKMDLCKPRREAWKEIRLADKLQLDLGLPSLQK